MRAISDEHASIIKAATAAAFEALGGVSRAAEALGVASSTLSKYASTGEEWRDSFIRLDLAVELDRRCDHPFLLTAMSRIVKDERVSSFGAVTASAVLRLDGVLDDVVRAVAAALEDDDHIDAAERQAIRNRIVAAQQYLARLDAMMMAGAR
ncbi:hypothetical protein CN204_32565 [Sinorhizobium meliloti]|uniref:Uncharacterized protein n=2 Tax=Rhizobium meliloti TaxID=382 RepID=F7XA61_SINMM|nr:hypothetical protein [Sinorhizobium meliloti]PST26055.1 hypothetical protein C7U62_12820 [Mesorhizobium loti]AEH79157.1 hypothetical protein SM11_chr1890 [Sinorhizobium meliloti SM11]ARS72099.1 hypothetical protein SMRU11_35155 [Sinorhizobium meliloti RU11/001]ASP51392.1 hypothetical protein CDO31_07295 [Sinorhizobium meliloti]MBP2467305.1 hypothetical protein [Sinorhizobium meliloti]